MLYFGTSLTGCHSDARAVAGESSSPNVTSLCTSALVSSGSASFPTKTRMSSDRGDRRERDDLHRELGRCALPSAPSRASERIGGLVRGGRADLGATVIGLTVSSSGSG